MLEVLEFLFSSPWIWLGSVAWLAILVNGIGATIESLKGKK